MHFFVGVKFIDWSLVWVFFFKQQYIFIQNLLLTHSLTKWPKLEIYTPTHPPPFLFQICSNTHFLKQIGMLTYMVVFFGSHTYFLVKPGSFWNKWLLSVSIRCFLIKYGAHLYVVVQIVHYGIHKYFIHKVIIHQCRSSSRKIFCLL